MTTTQTARPTGLLAARINTGDVVEIEGVTRTVQFARMQGTVLVAEWTDGSVSRINPLRTITVWL